MADRTLFVAEMPGLYGPFTMHERVLQKIWLQQDFAGAGATLVDGRRLEVDFPGRWNLLGGPDFAGASVRVNGRELRGDVEVHFRARDWQGHGHRENPAFANVVLHVLLYPPEDGAPPPCRADGAVIPALVLLPLLHRDLEEYAADDALEALTARDDWRRIAELTHLPVQSVRDQLTGLARRRWMAKVECARTRIARVGWTGAAHRTALEIMGYRHNRAPMLAAAERHALAAWSEPEVAAAVWAEVAGWQAQGVRPANHPRRRLAQYADWVRNVPDWPARWEAWDAGSDWAAQGSGMTTCDARRLRGMAAMRDRLAGDVVGGVLTGPRLETLVCDGLLPLLAARQGREDLFGAWFHWFAGDVPDAIRRHLKGLGITGSRDWPLNHGWTQGLLAWLIEREFRS